MGAEQAFAGVVKGSGVSLVAGKEQLCLLCQRSAAAVAAAGGGAKQGEAEGILTFLHDAPCLGIGHAHFLSGSPKGGKPPHIVKKAHHAGAESLVFLGKNAYRQTGVKVGEMGHTAASFPMV